jgi:filamentous hemagglutinin family protein
MKPKTILTIHLLTFTLSTNAQITTDGSLGPLVNLSGPDYQITSDLGQQHGGNLFHSFQEFNLQHFESANFSGADNVQNVISRVTGGHLSNIDGTIRSTMPNADFYFLNPYGILFGPHVKLDVPGSFHASTADYLNLGDGGRFDARQPSNSLLTVAPVEAFGFLDNQIAGISIKGIGEIAKAEGTGKITGLKVPNGKNLSIIGGDIEMTGSYYHNDDYIPEYRGYIRPLGNLTAASGRINLVSVASKGIVIPTIDSLDISSFNQLGKISLSQKSLIEVSGPIAGSLFIRANQLVVSDDSRIFNNILDYQYDNAIFSDNNLYANIDIKLQHLTVTDKSWIAGYSFSAGDLGDILIQADDISLTNGSWINSQSYTSGNTGNISIKTAYLHIEDGGIGIVARNTGNAGDIHIQASKTISVTGADSEAGWSSGILSIATPNETGIIGGIGGDILLETKDLTLEQGAQISSSSIAGEGKQSGRAGNITIHATGSVQLSGVNPYGENENGLGSGIYVGSLGHDAGDAGTISLTADSLLITDGAKINASTSGAGQGGQIHLNINDSIFIRGDSAQIILEEPRQSQLDFQNSLPDGETAKIAISGIYADSFSHANNAGEAGVIEIKANQLNLSDQALINTSTQQASGGHITVITSNLIYLQKSGITTSVQGGIGNGGNITLANPNYIVLDQSQVKAQADQGQGGNIRIVTKHFVKSSDSLVSASSRLGIDGQVEIDSLNENINEGIQTLSAEIMDASTMLQKSCDTMTYEDYQNRSRFEVHPIAGHPASPYDLQPSQLPPLPVTSIYQKTNQVIPHAQPLTSLTVCQPATETKSDHLKQPTTQAVIKNKVIPAQLF